MKMKRREFITLLGGPCIVGIRASSARAFICTRLLTDSGSAQTYRASAPKR
jgi:hypothetical protein